jgi:hypothetical protein
LRRLQDVASDPLAETLVARLGQVMVRFSISFSNSRQEFISKELDLWALMRGVTLDFSRRRGRFEFCLLSLRLALMIPLRRDPRPQLGEIGGTACRGDHSILRDQHRAGHLAVPAGIDLEAQARSDDPPAGRDPRRSRPLRRGIGRGPLDLINGRISIGLSTSKYSACCDTWSGRIARIATA